VVTNGGILGKVNRVKDDYLVVEIAANVEVVVQRNAVSHVLQTGTIKSIT
jgi:preprotein translocase subunit YajC